MGLSDYKITDEQVAANGLVASPDKLTGNPDENKALFDKLVREIVKAELNGLIDALIAAGGAGEIGFDPTAGVNKNNVQEAIENVQTQIAGVVLGQITDGTITAAKMAEATITLAKIAAGVLHTDNVGFPSAVAVALGIDPETTTVSEVLARLAEKFVLSGETAPTTETAGTLGQLYVNTTNLAWYHCIGVAEETYTWQSFESHRIGDIRQSARTDLGDTWALCNGAAVSATIYPELYELLLKKLSGSGCYNPSGDVFDLSHVNGYYICLGQQDSTDYPLLWYCPETDITNWTQVVIATSARCPHDITYANGQYIIAMRGASNYATVYYCATLDGTWNNQVLGEVSASSPQIVSVDNTVVVSYYNASLDTTYLHWITDGDPSGTWINTTYPDYYGFRLTCTNGNFVVTGRTTSLYPGILYSATGTAWSYKLLTDTITIDNSGTDFQYCESIGYIFFGAKYGTPDYPYVLTCETLDGDWTVTAVTGLAFELARGYYSELIEQWIIIGKNISNVASIATASALDGSWAVAAIAGNGVRGFVIGSDGLILVAVATDSDHIFAYPRLPSISAAGYYTYIKLQEGIEV